MKLRKTIVRGAAGIVVLSALLLCFFHASPSAAPGTTKVSDTPQCQEVCLRNHSERMKQLAEGYSKSLNRMDFQDKVEEEVRNYSRCLTECRVLLPVK
jgi:hypothetical protein